MSLVTITLPGLQFALGAGSGHIATDVAWLPNTLAAYDSKPVQTPPTLMPPVDMLGSGPEKYAHSPTLLTTDGYYHQFSAVFDASSGGASSKLTKALWAYIGIGGAVSVYGLDPYNDDAGASVDGRVFEYCYWDGLMKGIKNTQRVSAWGGYVVAIDFYRMTRRIP